MTPAHNLSETGLHKMLRRTEESIVALRRHQKRLAERYARLGEDIKRQQERAAEMRRVLERRAGR